MCSLRLRIESLPHTVRRVVLLVTIEKYNTLYTECYQSPRPRFEMVLYESVILHFVYRVLSKSSHTGEIALGRPGAAGMAMV